AIKALERGATISGTRDVNEEGNAVKKSLTVALTDEPSDTRLGTPTVYLGLDESGAVIMAGYSAATSALGFGSLSFSDAVKNENIVEKTLAEAGVTVETGTAKLPEDKTAYSTYATDGTTLVQEKTSFNGTADVAGVERKWSAVLVYDYKLANASGNLADTIRQIYIYLEA
ncbi:MAG: histone-lysine N-methyltransferase, partial [Raoultibacter sp.]